MRDGLYMRRERHFFNAIHRIGIFIILKKFLYGSGSNTSSEKPRTRVKHLILVVLGMSDARTVYFLKFRTDDPSDFSANHGA